MSPFLQFAVALMPLAVFASPQKDEVRKLVDDVTKQLTETTFQTLEINGEFWDHELRYPIIATLSNSKLDPFKINKVLAVTGDSFPDCSYCFHTSLKFSAKLTANFKFVRGKKKLAELLGYSCEWTKLPFYAKGSLGIEKKSNALAYSTFDANESPRLFASKKIVRGSKGEELKEICDEENDACLVEVYGFRALSRKFAAAISEAFSESLRKLQWKHGLTRTSGLNVDDIRKLINANFGKEPYRIWLYSPRYEGGPYSCIVAKHVSTGRISAKDVDIQKQGEAIIASFKVRKAKFQCAAISGYNYDSVKIPLLSSVVKLEPDNSNPTAPFALKCAAAAATKSMEDSDPTVDEHIGAMTAALNDELTLQVCRFMAEMGALSWSNFPELRRKVYQS